MNILLWVLQVLTALMYLASGGMKVFMFDKISQAAPSFGAFPKEEWIALGVIELICTLGLIVPGVLRRSRKVTVAAALILAVESLLLIWAQVQYHDTVGIIVDAVLGLIMVFIAYGRSRARA